MVDKKNYLLKVEDLRAWFPIKKGLLRRTIGYIKAADGISFGIKAGQTFGLVGESGCGKTTVAKSIARLIPEVEGKITFEQMDVLSADKAKARRLSRDISLIFQDPFSSLNPRMTIGSIIGEPLKVHPVRETIIPRHDRRTRLSHGMNRAETGSGSRRSLPVAELSRTTMRGGNDMERVAELLRKVGLAPDYMSRYPHEFSSGQRQRIGIARALALQPKLVICDEPVGSLDVSVQSQILNLLKDLQADFGLTFLFIAHDLAVVEFFCDVVAVMYMGKIVEQAEAAELYRNPLHPYTRKLLSAIPQGI